MMFQTLTLMRAAQAMIWKTLSYCMMILIGMVIKHEFIDETSAIKHGSISARVKELYNAPSFLWWFYL